MTSRSAQAIMSKPSERARPRLAQLLNMLGVTILVGAAHAVQITEGSFEGRPQFIVTTDSATWSYDRAGGGFSRLIDPRGRDWIAFSNTPLNEFPASAAAGYRGLGNLVFGANNPDAGAGHPGFDQCVSEIVELNRIRTRSRSGNWQWSWSFTESRATFLMEKADPGHAWWFLYEGPVAGRFAPSQQYWGTDQGGPNRDIPDLHSQRFGHWRWAYFGDDSAPRVFFAAQHEPDELDDTFWYLGSNDGGATTAPDGMVVFGFGRGPGTRPLFRGAGQRVTVGLLDMKVDSDADHAALATRIRALIDHDLCWHHPALWGLLPETTDPVPVVPEWPEFIRGCVRYRQSLDEQAPNAPRTNEPSKD
jgi:hypothetical protein